MRSKRSINIESAWAIRRRSSARVPTASVTPSTKLTCANGDDKRTLQLFTSLRDLIHGTFRRDNAGWSSENLRFTGLPTTGRLLVSQMDQAIRLFESKHHKQGGIMLRETFRSLEGIMGRDAIEIYHVVLLYIPFYLPGRYKDVTRAWLHFTSQMLNLKKRHNPISQLAKLLYSIQLNDTEHLAPALERLHSITADTYTELRGTKDLSTLLATIELLLVKGCSNTSQESTTVIQKLGSLVEEAAGRFGETSETTIGIEACQITAAARLLVAPTDPEIIELCKEHVGRVSAAEKTSISRHGDCGADSGYFVGRSRGHEGCVHCGGLESKKTYSKDLDRALEVANEQAGALSSVDSPDRTSRRNRLFWREILRSLGRVEEATEVWRGSFSRHANVDVEEESTTLKRGEKSKDVV
ncbi:N1-acetylpolyamine oxidase [Colletotrichum chrysophilum]|uniref:N1-acetylpolyamine oxidase n=1 Tax=Colletotrichum chrysophilum TaxID=1836956 RepID=A0AAD8ZYS3_9PEZI|nr:N1-acetylpolyamine oxidase [Colletotrichum chrysophilum]